MAQETNLCQPRESWNNWNSDIFDMEGEDMLKGGLVMGAQLVKKTRYFWRAHTQNPKECLFELQKKQQVFLKSGIFSWK